MKKAMLMVVLTTILIGPIALAETLLTARRHVDTVFTNQTFDSAVDDMNMRLRIDNGVCDDHPCTATFKRDGNVGTFGTAGDGLDVIDNSIKLSTVFSQPGQIKVVTYIFFCDGAYDPSLSGCSECPGDDIIVESTAGAQTYLHEYGHSIEIHPCHIDDGHRNDCIGNVMHEAGAGYAVNEQECQAFGGIVNTGLYGAVYNGNAGPLTFHDGPYWVVGDVWVPSSEVLDVEPEVEVQFKHDFKLTADGILNIYGDVERVLFFSNTPGYPSVKIDGRIRMKNGGELILY
jgi:hypothetical protein